jgi:hypothetical protein
LDTGQNGNGWTRASICVGARVRADSGALTSVAPWYAAQRCATITAQRCARDRGVARDGHISAPEQPLTMADLDTAPGAWCRYETIIALGEKRAIYPTSHR